MFCRNTRSLWSQSSLYLPADESYYKKKVNHLPVGVKWKAMKNVHCPPLLIDTGLMSIGPLTKKLLQKHRPVSYNKNRRKRALSPRSLTESSARERALPVWSTLRRLVWASAYYIEGKLWKRRRWNMISFALLAVTLLRFFLGKSIWSYCRLSLNVSRISKTKPT